MTRKNKRGRTGVTLMTAFILAAMTMTSCGASQENSGTPSSVQESSVVQSAVSNAAEQSGTESGAEPDGMTIEKIQNMEDSTAQNEAAVAMYEEIKANPTENVQQAADLLIIMAKNKFGEGIIPDADLQAKLNGLLESNQGDYFIIPEGEGSYLPITMYDKNGKEILDYHSFYYPNNDVVLKYHGTTAPSIGSYDVYTEPGAYDGHIGGGSIYNFLSSLSSNENDQDYEFTYDDLGRLTQVKWKEYPAKLDKDDNWVVSKNQFKMAQYDLTYQENGYLLSAVRSGYDYCLDKGVGYAKCDCKYEYGPSAKIKLDMLFLEDGTCVPKAVAKSNKKATNGEEILQTFVDGKIYYDIRKDRIARIYCCEQIGDGLEVWRKYKFYYKSKGDVKDIIEAKTSYVIYRGKNASSSAWTDEQTKEFLFDYFYVQNEL